MRLSEVVEAYIMLKLSVGMRFETDATILRSFCKKLADQEIEDIQPECVLSFINGKDEIKKFGHRKLAALRGFYRFAIARNYVQFSPLPMNIPKPLPPVSPYIYSSEEVRSLLSNVPAVCRDSRCDIDGDTLRTLLILLWGTGLRISEVLHLKISDLDFVETLVTVRDTKFFKSRLVPLDPALSLILSQYIESQRHRTRSEEALFFATRRGKRLRYMSVWRYFRRLCERAGIKRDDSLLFQPRIHDLRHAFATNRILSWYRQSADVQRLLPCLSTYLGHGTLAATQRYLTATPEVLREACYRFEQYALEVNDA